MVDAKAGDLSLGQEPQDQAVRLLKDVGPLHADGRQLVDVEKPAIVDLVRGHAPIGEPVGLVLQQLVQQIEAPRVPLHAVKERHILLKERVDLGGGGRRARPGGV